MNKVSYYIFCVDFFFSYRVHFLFCLLFVAFNYFFTCNILFTAFNFFFRVQSFIYRVQSFFFFLSRSIFFSYCSVQCLFFPPIQSLASLSPTNWYVIVVLNYNRFLILFNSASLTSQSLINSEHEDKDEEYEEEKEEEDEQEEEERRRGRTGGR